MDFQKIVISNTEPDRKAKVWARPTKDSIDLLILDSGKWKPVMSEDVLRKIMEDIGTATEIIEGDTPSYSDMQYGKMYLDEENDSIFVPINEPGESVYKVLEFSEDGLFLNEKVGSANQRTKLSPRLTDLTPEERASLKGPQGDSAIWTGEGEPWSGLKNTTGQSTTEPMSQKAVTDELWEPIEQVSNDVTEGYIRIENGKKAADTTHKVSPFLPLFGGEKKISCANVYVGASGTAIASFAFYSSNSSADFISSAVGTSAEVPSGATHFRMTGEQSVTSWTVKYYGISKQAIFDRLPEIGQISRLEEDVYSPVTTHHNQVSSTGYIDASGDFVSNTEYRTSGYIELKGETYIGSSKAYTTTTSTSVVSRMAFYDSSKEFISAINATNRGERIGVPESAKYVRMSARPSINGFVDQFDLVHYGMPRQDIYDKVESIEDAMDIDDLSGKTIAFIGDSITKGQYGVTEGNAYTYVFAGLTGCSFINLGENSAVYASNPSGGNTVHPRLIDKVTSENLSSVDMVVVFAGTNDFSYDSKAIGQHFAEETITATDRIGNKKRVPPSDTDTFSGAVHELILAIRAIIGEKPMLIMTPLNRGKTAANSTNPNTAECNANGDYLHDFVDALKDIGRFYSIPVFETGAYFNVDPTKKSGTGQSSYFYDCLHPNAAGHARLGKLLYKFVKNNLVI